MKKKHKKHKHSTLLLAALFLFLNSCVNGYNDNWEFSSNINGTELESPNPEEVKITKTADSKGKEVIKIEWPVVHGAGGYLFTLYNVDDPNTPIPVGEENEIIDGCSVTRSSEEDTKYQISIKTLGNEKYNNLDAKTATIINYTTLIPVSGIIPDGSDLAEYFTNNPIEKSDEEQAYELVPGGNYTLNSSLNLGLHSITLRGDKIHHPNVVYGKDGRLSTMGGLKLKFINFDCSNINSSSSNGSFLLLDSDPDESIKGHGDYYIIENDIVLQSCGIKNINRHLLYDNNKKYCPKTFRVQDCIISLNSTKQIIYFQGGFINNLMLLNNTIYSPEGVSCQYFIQYNNSGRPDRAGFPNGNINLSNNTLYSVAKTDKMANYSGMRSNLVTLTLVENLFVDCGNKEVVRHLAGNNRNMTRNISNNCYWYEGGFKDDEEMGQSHGDNSEANKAPSSGFYEDPKFIGPINNVNPLRVNFTPTGKEILKREVGDPHWLPNKAEINNGTLN
ncbi:MAG: DUF4957 domain-containing protein [Bacteroidales bacterium]|nr:DUF4957 domain-containing protein [Bacteroidales bacterium]